MSRQQVPLKMLASNSVASSQIVDGTITGSDLSNYIDQNGAIRVKQNLGPTPNAGKGMELLYDAATNIGYIQVMDRDGGGLKPLTLSASTVNLPAGSVDNSELAGSIDVAKLDQNTVFAAGPRTTDWFRNNTAGQGIFNVAVNQGIAFDASGPYMYPSLLRLATGTKTAALRVNTIAAPNLSTTSTTAVGMGAPFGSIPFNMAGGTFLLFVSMSVYLSTGAPASILLTHQVDGAGFSNVHGCYRPVANVGDQAAYIWAQGGLSAGSHTLQMGWRVTAGTAQMNTGIYSAVLGVEIF